VRLGLLVLSLRNYEYVRVRIVSEWEKDLLFSLCFAQSGVRKLACGRIRAPISGTKPCEPTPLAIVL
jgi:hypothetical protein